MSFKIACNFSTQTIIRKKKKFLLKSHAKKILFIFDLGKTVRFFLNTYCTDLIISKLPYLTVIFLSIMFLFLAKKRPVFLCILTVVSLIVSKKYKSGIYFIINANSYLIFRMFADTIRPGYKDILTNLFYLFIIVNVNIIYKIMRI